MPSRRCRYVASLQLVGGSGTAKTCTIQQFLGRFSKDDHSNKTITFSYLTTPGIFQQSIEVTRAICYCAVLPASAVQPRCP